LTEDTWRDRLARLPLRWVALSAAVVLAVVGVTVAVTHDGGPRRTESLLADDPSTAPGTPSPDAVATSSAPTALPSATPERSASSDPSSTALPSRCEGPLAPGAMADASCDALHPHSGLPHPCISPRNACAWPDAHGAVPAGPYDLVVKANGDSLHVTWSTTSQDLAGDRYAGPVHQFVLRLLHPGSDTVLTTRFFATSVHATDLTGLAPGHYDVLLQELNDSGLSAGIDNDATIAAPPPSPTPSPTPSPEPTPTPTS
jgi:hypothetical protein